MVDLMFSYTGKTKTFLALLFDDCSIRKLFEIIISLKGFFIVLKKKFPVEFLSDSFKSFFHKMKQLIATVESG